MLFADRYFMVTSNKVSNGSLAVGWILSKYLINHIHDNQISLIYAWLIVQTGTGDGQQLSLAAKGDINFLSVDRF